MNFAVEAVGAVVSVMLAVFFIRNN